MRGLAGGSCVRGKPNWPLAAQETTHDTKALREQRAKLIGDAVRSWIRAEAEHRTLSVRRAGQPHQDRRGHRTPSRRRLTRAERVIKPRPPTSCRSRQRQERLRDELRGDERAIAYANAFGPTCAAGCRTSRPNERQILHSGYQPLETREQNLTGANGGFTVAPNTSFYNQLQDARSSSAGCSRRAAPC